MKSKQNDFVKKDLPLIDQLGFEKKHIGGLKIKILGRYMHFSDPEITSSKK